MPVTHSTRGLANTVHAVGRKGHYPGDLLDFELLAGPAQAFAQLADRRHGRTCRAAGRHAARAAAVRGHPVLPPPPRVRRIVLVGGRRVELGLDQALWIVAVRLVELPILRSNPRRPAAPAQVFRSHKLPDTAPTEQRRAACRNLIMKPGPTGIAGNQPAERVLAARLADRSARKSTHGLRRAESRPGAPRSCAWFGCRRRFCRRRDPP